MQIAPYLLNSIYLLTGIITLITAICNADWFYNARSVMLLVKWFSRTGTRLLYGGVGLLLICTSLYALITMA